MLILNAQIVNEGKIFEGDIWIQEGRIAQIGTNLSGKNDKLVIDAKGKFVMAGVIDDQVHFREPGLTHKAQIYTEAKAAVAGGTTSFMEMPNTNPQTLTQDLLAQKYEVARRESLANYSFFMGVSNNNLEEVLKTDRKSVCGLKIFMGSSTGNMLVDNRQILERVFAETDLLIATHCEDEPTVRKNLADYQARYGEAILPKHHPEIRNEEACLRSSTMAVELAKKYNTRLHILHISTADEISLFTNEIPLAEKRITAEACVHHLWFDSDDYERLGNQIKCNPAIKNPSHKPKILEAVLSGKIDIIATDHAPHTWQEKSQAYNQAPAGVPLVQHSLLMMLDFYHQNKISLPQIAEKMAHNPAICFQMKERGFIREGYWADLVIFDTTAPTQVSKENILYKCGWSPFEGYTFGSKITQTIVSGHLAYNEGVFDESKKGERLFFER
ncbi:dihydroorotase [Hugenholtzia roseola]|uniref:dihydroorotase n=1 Tax=Hugenholtzia roseola TaxID=1002 RepID=UPI00040CC39D|nr:dihydroorotase [Hugenholtzia roseola]